MEREIEVVLCVLAPDAVWADADVWLRRVLGLRLGVAGGLLTIARQARGKPYLPVYPGFHFSLSHTRGALACACGAVPVGVDLERLRKWRLPVVSRFFGEREAAYVLSAAQGRDERFTEIWTRKEAYVKCLGTGTETDFASFDVLAPAEKASGSRVFWRGGYAIGVYAEGGAFAVRITEDPASGAGLAGLPAGKRPELRPVRV